MKIHGKKFGERKKTVVLPINDEENAVFVLQPVDFSEAEKLYNKPQPPKKMLPGGEQQDDVEDPEYKKKIDDWATKQTAYMIWKSLEATPGLEWEKVVANKPDTWNKYEEELKDLGLTDPEITRLVTEAMNVCGLNQDKIDEATKNFLATQGARQKS